MIAKIIYGGGFYGVFAYAESKEKSLSVSENGLEDKPGYERLSVNNFHDGRNFFSSKAQLADSLKRWSLKSKRVEKGVFHASIALPPGEKLSNEDINSLACAYMEKMGYGENPFVIYKHNDTHHEHLHIISSRVGDHGKLVNPSFEFKKNLGICRELEKEWGLQPVSSIKQKIGPEVQPIQASYTKKAPFKSNVLQNVEYAIKVKKIPSLEELSLFLKKRNIELVYNHPDGHRFPNAGILFYRLSDRGERESRLKGWSLGKSYGRRLETRLARNAALEPETSGPGADKSSLSYQDQLQVSKALFNTYNELVNSVIFEEADILRIAEFNGLTLSIKHNKAGFNGFSILKNGLELKPSDFTYQSIKLSSSFIKNRLPSPENENALYNFYLSLLSQSGKLGLKDDKSIIRFFNRHGLHLQYSDGGAQVFIIGNPGLSINLKNDEIPPVLRGTTISKPLQKLDFSQISLYNSLLQGNVNSLAQLSRHRIDFDYFPDEVELQKGLSLFRSYVDINNRLKICLAAENGKYGQISFPEILQKLNNRGLEVSVEGSNGQIRGLIITDKTTGRQLNRFNLIYPFNNLNWVKTQLTDLNLLTNQRVDIVKAGIFNHYEKTGTISSDQFLLLQNDPHYRSDLMRLFFRLQKKLTDGELPKVPKNMTNANPQHSKAQDPGNNARGDSDIQYGRVYNNTIFQDLWDGKAKGI